MDTAKELMMKHPDFLEKGLVVVAETQKKGRGSHGRFWESDSPGGLYYSLLIKPDHVDLNNSESISFELARTVGLVIQDVTGLDPKLKPPNDVLLDNKKVSGTLIECSTHASSAVPQFLLVGIGININQDKMAFSVEDEAVSLFQLTGKKYPKKLFIDKLTEQLLNYFYGFS